MVESILNAYSAGKVIDYYAPLPQGIREELYFFSGFSDDNAAIRTEGALISQEGDCETFYIIAAARFTPSAASIARAAKMRDVQRARGDAQEDQSQTTNRSSD